MEYPQLGSPISVTHASLKRALPKPTFVARIMIRAIANTKCFNFTTLKFLRNSSVGLSFFLSDKKLKIRQELTN